MGSKPVVALLSDAVVLLELLVRTLCGVLRTDAVFEVGVVEEGVVAAPQEELGLVLGEME